MNNKKNISLLLVLIFSFFIFSLSLFGADLYERPITIISPAVSALGGPHTTMNDGFSTLMNNPAGFYSVEPEFSIAEVTLGVKGPVFDITNLIVSADMSGLPALLQGIYTGLDMLGPVSFGYVGNGLGLGIYTNTYSTLSSSGPLTVKADAGTEVILSGGYSMRFPMPENHILDAGMLLKGTFRGEISFEESALTIMNIDLASLINKPFAFITGVGVDAGLRYSFRNQFTVGLVGRDLYSPTLHNTYTDFNLFSSGGTALTVQHGVVPFSLDLGVMYSPDMESRNIFISDIKIYLDYYDILDFWLYPSLAVNPFLHIGIGSEITMLSILDVRIGFNEGLFSAGLGLDLYYFKLNMAMFGTEQSTEPGLQPVYNLQMGFEFRI